jgi:hypothetical protein
MVTIAAVTILDDDALIVQLTANFGSEREKFGIVFAEELLDIFADLASHGGALPAGRDGEDELALLDDGGHDKVAVGYVVNGVDPHALAPSLVGDGLINGTIIGRDEGEEVALHIAILVFTADVGDFAIVDELLDFGAEFVGDECYAGASVYQAAEFLVCDMPTTNDYDGLVLDIKKYWVIAH